MKLFNLKRDLSESDVKNNRYQCIVLSGGNVRIKRQLLDCHIKRLRNIGKPCKDNWLTFHSTSIWLIEEKTMGFSRGALPLELDCKVVPWYMTIAYGYAYACAPHQCLKLNERTVSLWSGEIRVRWVIVIIACIVIENFLNFYHVFPIQIWTTNYKYNVIIR